METSKHASKRIRKRVGIKKKAVDSIRDAAFEKGLTHKEVSGNLSRYLDKLYLEHNTANNIRIYSNYVWIFAGQTLITVFPIPGRLRKAALYTQQKKSK